MSNRKMCEEVKNPDIRVTWPLGGVGAALGGVMRTVPEDFRVEERRPEPLSHDGEHWVARIEKRSLTTDQVALWLAEGCGVKRESIGFAGQKDRHAVAVQDFSIHVPGGVPIPFLEREPLLDGVRILDIGRHRRKIRPGHLSGNHFRIRLRGCRRDDAAAQRVAERLRGYGFPNYFGPQRFGHDADNVAQGVRLLSGSKWGEQGWRPTRHQQGLYLSAVRSYYFNQVLAARIRSGLFQELLAGDVVMLAGRSSCFRVEDLQTEQPRFAAGDIIPTGPMFGRKLMAPTGIPGAMEATVAAQAGEIPSLLERHGLDGARRALVTQVPDLVHEWEGNDLLLAFTLSRGSYATMVLREFMAENDEDGAGMDAADAVSADEDETHSKTS